MELLKEKSLAEITPTEEERDWRNDGKGISTSVGALD